MAKKVSLQMVADEAECSVGVVSAILNKSGNGVIRASEKTQRKVIQAARKLGVKAGHSSHRIGIYAQHIDSSLPIGYVEILSALIVQEALKCGLAIEILSDEKLQPKLDAGLDGVIGVGWSGHLADLGGIPYFPVVTINQPMTENGIHSVSSNHEQQAYLAAAHAMKKGHKHIAMLETQPGTWGYRQRYAGYEKAHKEFGLEVDPSRVGHTQERDLNEVLAGWIDHGVTLILNFHAQQALETLHILANVMGLRIGEDISTITIDDLPVFRYFVPPQTVVHQSLDNMASTAVSLINNLIENPEPKPTPEKMDDICFSCKLIERESVKDLTG